MSRPWIQITDGSGTRSRELAPGMTRIGPAGSDVELSGAGSDELRVWDAPPRAVFVGTGAPPLHRGRAVLELALAPGVELEWRGARLCLVDAPGGSALLEEIPLAPSVVLAEDAGRAGPEPRAWTRLRAALGLAVSKADPAVAKRWQEAVLRGDWQADRCAQELLAAREVPVDDPAVLERAGQLLRDFLMAPLLSGLQGARRRTKRAVQGGVAFLVTQVVVLTVLSLMLLTALLLLRIRGLSVDGFLDRILRR